MDPSFKRTPAIPVGTLRGSLPKASIGEDVDHGTVASQNINLLDSLNVDSFVENASWRDLWALTGTTRTFFGSQQVAAAWTELAAQHHPYAFALVPNSSLVIRAGPQSAWIQWSFTFETKGSPGRRCSGVMGVVPDENKGWKIYVLSTILEEIKGFPSPDVLKPQSIINGARKEVNGDTAESSFDCVVIGAGMAGLSTAGRLKAMGLSYVVLERNDQIGDNWLLRYDSAKLHTCRDYGHLPFSRTFPPDEPYYLSARDLAKGFQRFVNEFGIKVWLQTNLESASWNETERLWKLQIRQKNSRDTTIISTPHVVLCTGAGGQFPKMPSLPNREIFQGTVMHSKEYKSSHAWSGKAGMVIGSANTAHDVASDMVEAGLKSVTMVQRNRTSVVPVEYYNAVADPVYNVKIPTEVADRLQFCLPIAVSRLMAMNRIHRQVDEDSARFDKLEEAGFKVERYGDMFVFLCERLGGHHLDVGASAKITQGLIQMKSDAAPISYTPTGIEFSDGSKIDADVIIFCTGFEGNLRTAAGRLFGPEVEEGLEDFWGVDAEGEIRGAWKPQGYPGIWYHGGTIGHARFFSRFLALQIKADVEGVPLEQYKKTPL